MDWSKAEIQSRVHLGAIWGQRHIWVQTGDPKHTYTESEKREGVTRVSISLGHLMPRVSTPLVHLSHVGPTPLQTWQVGPTYATWQSAIDPHQQPPHTTARQMAACYKTTSTAQCHVAFPCWSTSLNSWHMAEYPLTQSDQTEQCGCMSLVHITDHITILATWPSVSDPHQQEVCQMAAHRVSHLSS
jgi:hypothetical protein